MKSLKINLIFNHVQQMVDPIPDFPKLLFDVGRNVNVCDVSSLDHLSVDEEGQLQESRVRDRAGQVSAVEQRDLTNGKIG